MKIIQSSLYRIITPKGIASDSNNIFLWHKSEDINQKKKKKGGGDISNISVDPNSTLTSYAWLCALALLHRPLC